MPFRLGVFQVKSAAQSIESIVVGLFELDQRSGKLSGSLLDQLLQLPDAAVFFIFYRSSIHTRFPANVASCLEAAVRWKGLKLAYLMVHWQMQLWHGLPRLNCLITSYPVIRLP